MTTRPVIQNVRLSLGRSPETPLSQRPPVYPPRQPGPVEAEVDLFLHEIKNLSGVGVKLAPSEVSRALSGLVAQHSVRKAAVWGTDHLNQLAVAGCLSTLGVELISPDAGKGDLAQCDLGVTEADYLLPETGTIVLRSSAERPRAVSLLPRIHLAIVRPELLRADLHQVFIEAKASPYLVFITGPSRTADIELTTTLGVHGPKNLYVWMMKTSGAADL